MKNRLWTIGEVSEYLNVKRSTLYSWVRNGTIPAYKIGGVLLFKQQEIMGVVEASRVKPCNVRTLRKKSHKNMNIDAIVNKAVAEFKPKEYTRTYGKPDQAQGLKEGGFNGTI